MIKQETVPCETCGEPTTYTGTKRCNNCYEVETRLDKFLQNPKALILITKKLRELELKYGAAEAIEFYDEDELEEYSSLLEQAKMDVKVGVTEDITNWVKLNEIDELHAFISQALQLDKLTLSELKNRYNSYIDHQVTQEGQS